jgi:ERCC4-type nuclease
MEIVADDRERIVIEFLKSMRKIKVDRLTVGDYVFVYRGKIIVIVERKTLVDLACSIRDGRMENNTKLLNLQRDNGCKILYIIEGSAYPHLNKTIGRMPYKCLQGKLDSLLFKHDIKIIWTRDAQHTAERLSNLCVKFETLASEGVFGEFDSSLPEGGAEDNNLDAVKIKHEISIEQIQLNMLKCIPHISYKTAASLLKKYSLQQILLKKVSKEEYQELQHLDTGYVLGARGERIYNLIMKIGNWENSRFIYENILACIPGITQSAAKLILDKVPMENIVLGTFESTTISNIKKGKRCVGASIETKIKHIFNYPVERVLDN